MSGLKLDLIWLIVFFSVHTLHKSIVLCDYILTRSLDLIHTEISNSVSHQAPCKPPSGLALKGYDLALHFHEVTGQILKRIENQNSGGRDIHFTLGPTFPMMQLDSVFHLSLPGLVSSLIFQTPQLQFAHLQT